MTRHLCDEDCNNCPIVLHHNSRQLSLVLNALYERFGDGVYEIVQSLCPNMTVCFDCRIDDFVHGEGCEILDAAKKVAEGASLASRLDSRLSSRPKSAYDESCIQEVTKEKIMEIISSMDKLGKYEPLGLFLAPERDGWVAVDNLTGDAWTEAFDTRRDAVRFLLGEIDGEGNEIED